MRSKQRRDGAYVALTAQLLHEPLIPTRLNLLAPVRPRGAPVDFGVNVKAGQPLRVGIERGCKVHLVADAAEDASPAGID